MCALVVLALSGLEVGSFEDWCECNVPKILPFGKKLGQGGAGSPYLPQVGLGKVKYFATLICFCVGLAVWQGPFISLLRFFFFFGNLKFEFQIVEQVQGIREGS